LCDSGLPNAWIKRVGVAKGLAAAGRDESIIFITGHGDIPTRANAMKAGAIDFLPKPFRDEDLLDAIARSLKGSESLWREHTERTKIQTPADQLTPREREVMELVVAGKLNKQIAAELGASEKTIKLHRGRVMRKNAGILSRGVGQAYGNLGNQPG